MCGCTGTYNTMCRGYVFFFFRQKTAYELRISDWSSDVCSSDLLAKRLTLYRLRRPIVIGRDDALAVHWSAEGEAGSPDPRLAALGRRWIAPADGEAAGYDERRIARGVPEGAAALGGDKTLGPERNAGEGDGGDGGETEGGKGGW